MAKLRRSLGLAEVVGLAVAGIGPTVAMAFNVSLAAGASGTGAPLAFVIGTVVLGVVALSYVAFSRRIASAGSAYAYVLSTFGPKAGFLVGWSMLLAYVCFASGVAALAGDFVSSALGDYGIAAPWIWRAVAIVALVAAVVLTSRDMRIATRTMLGLEIASVAAIVVLEIVVVMRAPAVGLEPFMPSADKGWIGIGYGLVFAVLSFAGFEAAATLGEESESPRRAIPIAMLATVIGAGAFYVFSAYAQVAGYGMSGMAALAADPAPLNTLAERWISREFATAIDLAAAVSAFSCILAGLSAAARILYSMSRAGLAPRLAVVDPVRGTPGAATAVVGVVALAGLLLWAPRVGAGDYFGDVGTIGTLALILVYLAVAAAATVVTLGSRETGWAAAGAFGTVALLWPLYTNLYPVPPFPDNLWPYFVGGWLAAGALVLAWRRDLSNALLEGVG